MSAPQEGRYTKIGTIATVVTVVLSYWAWQHPKSHSDQPNSPKTEVQAGTDVNGHGANHTPDDSSEEPKDGKRGRGGDRGGSPGPKNPMQACGPPEIANLLPGTQATVASGLAVLSVKTGKEGSEPYLTLGISSDRETLAKAVLGAPVRYRFATGRGFYFVNVINVDFAADAMTVQVGCEAKETMP